MKTVSKLKNKVNAKQIVEDFTHFLATSNDIIKYKDNVAFYVGKNQAYLFYTKEDKTITLFVSDIDNSTKTGLKLCKDKFSFELSHLEKGDDKYVGEKAFEFTYEQDLNEMIHEILNQPNMDDDKLLDVLQQTRKKPKELQINTMESMSKTYYEIIQDLNPLLKHPILTFNDLIEDNQQMAKQAQSHSSQMLIELNFLNKMCLDNAIIGDKKAIVFNDLDNRFYIDKKSMHLVFSSQNASFIAVQENEASWKIYSTGMYDNYSEPKELIPIINTEESTSQEFELKNMAAHIENGQLVYLNRWSDYMMSSLSFAAEQAEDEFGESMSFPVNLASVNYQLAQLYQMGNGRMWQSKASIYSYLFGMLGNGYHATANGELSSSDTNYNEQLAQNMDKIASEIPQGKLDDLPMLYDDVLNSFNGKIETNWANCINEFCDMLEEYKQKDKSPDDEDRVSVKDIDKWIKKAKALTGVSNPKNKNKIK